MGLNTTFVEVRLGGLSALFLLFNLASTWQVFIMGRQSLCDAMLMIMTALGSASYYAPQLGHGRP